MRPLSDNDRETLRARGCTAENWSAVSTAGNFSPENIRDTRFTGTVSLGARCTITNTILHNADVEDDVAIQNTDFIGQTGRSAFGNGEDIHVVAEDGARSVPLWHSLSAQWAHLMLHCKGTAAGRALERMVREDAATAAAERSRIGKGCTIRFAGKLTNVCLGEGTVVDSAAALTDVRTLSSKAAPVFIGEGVAAACCIFRQASRADGGSRLKHCLIGEGTRIDNAFFAEHCLFFANCDFALGEALGVLAGPFAVSHHRATLVLTNQNSFGNFGSGANASNHHFKLGPRHGGILRRGVRCGSGSYLLWPADIGAFSTVVGRHAHSLDTEVFPFSLVTTGPEGTVLVPGVNLFTAGLFRDERKWSERDRRTGIATPGDLYEPAILSPYTMEAAERGLKLLRAHRAAGGGDFHHNGATIPAARVDAGIALYETAIRYYAGTVLLKNSLKQAAAADTTETPPCENWRDWAGMLVRGDRAKSFLTALAEGTITTPAAVNAALREMHAQYRRDELRWAQKRWRREYAEQWPETVAAVFGRRQKDAAKEFSATAAYGFGVETEAAETFTRLRGALEDEPLVALMREERDGLLERP